MSSALFFSRNTFTVLFAIAAAMLVGACGGGGDSGPSYPSITYTGVNTAAVIDQSNAADFPFVVLENSGDAGNLPLAVNIDAQTAGDLPDTENIKKAAGLIANLVKNNFGTSMQQVTGVTETHPGNCGGSFTYSENVSNTSFSGSLLFDQYCEGDLTTYGYEFRLHGIITFSGTYHLVNNSPVFDSLNFNIQYLKMTFNDGATTASEEFSGSITVTSFDAANNPLDFNMTVNFEYEGKVFKVVNLQVDDFTGTISGTLYHPDHGYVDITTTWPFTYMMNDPFDDTDDQFCSGSLQITGSDGAGNTAVIDFTDYSCMTYDICITINTGPQVCSTENAWGTAPAVWN